LSLVEAEVVVLNKQEVVVLVDLEIQMVMDYLLLQCLHYQDQVYLYQ
jgi:hypothetical protein